MTEHTTCVVIGGGPAGMVLGLVLSRAGIEVTVLEKYRDFLRDFRGNTVHPSTLQLLDELGLGERFAKLPQSQLHEIAFPIDEHRRVVVGDLRRLKVRHPYIAMVPQWDLLTLLAEAGNEEESYTLRMRTEVIELIRESGRVHGVHYRTEDGRPGEIRADLTVACDGRWSIARQQADLRPKEFPVPFDFWWFRLPRKPSDDPPALMPQAGKGRFVIVIPREDYLQLGYAAKKELDAQLRARGVERSRQDIAELVPWLADRIDALESMDDVKYLDVRLNRLNRSHIDGLLCLGDSAHAMSPFGGVGINLAVQDAVAAATLLAEPLRHGAVTPGPWPGSGAAGCCRRSPSSPCRYSCTAPWLRRFLTDSGRARRRRPWPCWSASRNIVRTSLPHRGGAPIRARTSPSLGGPRADERGRSQRVTGVHVDGDLVEPPAGVICSSGSSRTRFIEARQSGLALAEFRAFPLSHSATLMKRSSASSTRERYIRARMYPGCQP